MRAAGAAVALFTRPEDVCYATGFEVPPPIDAGAAFAYGPSLAIVTLDGSTILLAPDAYGSRADDLSRADETVLVPGFGHFDRVDARAEFRKAIAITIGELGIGAGALAIDEATLPAEVRELLAGLLPGTAFTDASAIARKARLLKTDREIELLRKAAAAADAGHEALMALAAPGRNELDVLGDVLVHVNRAAGQPLPWSGELVSGPRTGFVRYPGGPLDRKMEEGDTVLMDLSVRYRGYWADCTNAFVLGEPSVEQLLYFRAARDACEAAIEQLRPGQLARSAHEAAVEAFHQYGLEPAHYTGHQIGCSVNEGPRLVPYDDTPIEARMVFAVEPGVYGGHDVGTGARCERVALVTESGPELLTRFRWGMD